MGATGRSGAAPESGLACSGAGCARQVFTTGVAPPWGSAGCSDGPRAAARLLPVP